MSTKSTIPGARDGGTRHTQTHTHTHAPEPTDYNPLAQGMGVWTPSLPLRQHIIVQGHSRNKENLSSRTVPTDKIDKIHYEFNMLYGIRRDLQDEILKSDQNLKILISYGEEWFPWYVGRFAENLKNLFLLLK